MFLLVPCKMGVHRKLVKWACNVRGMKVQLWGPQVELTELEVAAVSRRHVR